MLSSFAKRTVRSSTLISSRYFSKQGHDYLGFIGLGHMGNKMVKNLADDGHHLLIHDRSKQAINATLDINKSYNDGPRIKDAAIASIGEHCNIIFTMLPNDAVVEDVSQALLAKHASTAAAAASTASSAPIPPSSGAAAAKGKKIHVSCSTISPELAKKLTKKHEEHGFTFVSAPVFARPDGISRREAIFMLSGNKDAKNHVTKYLKLLGKIEDFGESTGAANVVKLCGNFLIAASIEAIAESMALAEKNGVDRHKVMSLLSSTIFDCLIYKGYGQRVSQRDHKPGGFSLELGYKDVTLVNKAARDVNVPMPFLSTLVDRYSLLDLVNFPHCFLHVFLSSVL
jgi:3-hydroxyisobutyrate dehydrogenase-like beta-hydroxyacid dehydrogenase